MIGGISSNMPISSSYGNSSANSTKNSLSVSQKETIESVLSNYDSENLTSEDATEIKESFQEAGIKPSKEMAETMALLGFDAKKIGNLATEGSGQGSMPPPPPPPPKEGEVSDITSLLDTLFSEEDEDSLTTSITSSEISTYSNQIANLNESAKSDVMSLLEKFTANNSDYSNEQMDTLVKNSLHQILGESENYTKRSYYA